MTTAELRQLAERANKGGPAGDWVDAQNALEDACSSAQIIALLDVVDAARDLYENGANPMFLGKALSALDAVP